MDKPVAIIVNTCNRPFILKNTIKELKGQIRVDDWIVVVNDGEKDSLPELDSGNLSIVQHNKPYYALASARNAGLKEAIKMGYEWGIFVDDDVEFSAYWLKNHREKWEDKKTIYAGKIVSPESKNTDYRLNKENDKMTELRLIKTGGCNFGTYLPFFSEEGGYKESFDGSYGCEDIELFYRLIVESGWDIEYLPKAKMMNLKAPPSSEYQRSKWSNREKLKEMVPEEYIWGDF